MWLSVWCNGQFRLKSCRKNFFLPSPVLSHFWIKQLSDLYRKARRFWTFPTWGSLWWHGALHALESLGCKGEGFSEANTRNEWSPSLSRLTAVVHSAHLEMFMFTDREVDPFDSKNMTKWWNQWRHAMSTQAFLNKWASGQIKKVDKWWRYFVETYIPSKHYSTLQAEWSVNVTCLYLTPVIIAGKLCMSGSGSLGFLNPKVFFNRAIGQPVPCLQVWIDWSERQCDMRVGVWEQSLMENPFEPSFWNWGTWDNEWAKGWL